MVELALPAPKIMSEQREQSLSHVSSSDSTSAAFCHVCGAPLPEGAAVCERCGATQNDEHKCPFCGAVAAAKPHPTFRYACPVCGAPRVPSASPDGTIPEEAVNELRKAKSAYGSRLAWRIGAVVTFVYGLLSLLVLAGATMAASPPTMAIVAGAVLSALPLFFSWLGWTKAKAREAQMNEALDASWVLSAKSLLRTQGPMTLPQMEKKLGLDELHAKNVVAALGASSSVHTRMNDDGQLEYVFLDHEDDSSNAENDLARKIDALAASTPRDERSRKIEALQSDSSEGKSRVATEQSQDPTEQQLEQQALAEALEQAEEQFDEDRTARRGES